MKKLTTLKRFTLVITLIIAFYLTSVLGYAQTTPLPDVVQIIQWHPQGEGLLVAGRGGPDIWGLWLYNADLELERFFQFDSSISADWSPDGTRFSMGRNIVDAQTLEVLVTLTATSGIGGWSPDGEQVLAWVDTTHLGLFNTKTGTLERQISIGNTPPDYVSWSPNGAYFALLQPTGQTDIIDAQNGLVIATMPMEYPLGLRWSPDSRYLVAGFTELVDPATPNILPDAASPTLALVRVWEVQTGKVIDEYSGMLSWVRNFRWNSDSNELIGTTPLGLIYIWNLETNTQKTLTTLGNLGPMDDSPYGGRFVIGASVLRQASTNERRQQYLPDTPYWSQVIVPNVLEIIVPAPSLDKLNAIASLCVRDSVQRTEAVSALTRTPIMSLEALPNFVAQIEALPDDAIPAACKADVLAVAQALMVQP